MKNAISMRTALLARVLKKLQNAFALCTYNRIFLMKDIE